ncbi:MAG: alpha/beta fold hydrolase [Planctomycetota bacterium]
MISPLLLALLLGVPGDEFEPGKVSTIKTKKLHYALRVPKKRSKKAGNPTIVFLHGSNMRGENYAWSLETARSLADWVLICPTGPHKVMDKDMYNHDPGDERYVAKVIEDVEERLGIKLSRVYVGGHSQGGFLSHAVAAHLPRKIDGVIACSSGSWVSPRKLVKKGKGRGKLPIPVALVHAQDDPVVDVRASIGVYDAYLKAGHEDVRLFIPAQGAHMFMRLPILDAVAWLDLMNETKRQNALQILSRTKLDKDVRTAWDAARIVKRLSKKGKNAKAESVLKKVRERAQKKAKDLEKRIKKAGKGLDAKLKAEAWSFLGDYGMLQSQGRWRKSLKRAMR